MKIWATIIYYDLSLIEHFGLYLFRLTPGLLIARFFVPCVRCAHKKPLTCQPVSRLNWRTDYPGRIAVLAGDKGKKHEPTAR